MLVYQVLSIDDQKKSLPRIKDVKSGPRQVAVQVTAAPRRVEINITGCLPSGESAVTRAWQHIFSRALHLAFLQTTLIARGTDPYGFPGVVDDGGSEKDGIMVALS